MRQRPSIGRWVRYRVQPGTMGATVDVAPALIVRVWPEGEAEGIVSLTAFFEHGNSRGFQSVPMGDVDTPGTWHWPPYEPPIADDAEAEAARSVAAAAAAFQQPPDPTPVDPPPPPAPDLPPAEAEPTFRPEPIIQPETTPETAPEPAPVARRRKGDAA